MGFWRFLKDCFLLKKLNSMTVEEKAITYRRVNHPLFPLDLNEFEPITEEALSYIAGLPTYQPLPRSTYFLPKEPGSYQLPLKFCEAQWNYLRQVLSQYKFIGGTIPRYLIKRLPGIEKVYFHSDIECEDPGIRCSMYPIPLRLKVWGIEDTPKRFDPKGMLSFESTIQGAITAFYMITDVSPILSVDNEEGFRFRGQFGEKLQNPIDIPYGFRLEIVNHHTYVIRCLTYAMFHDLEDLSCRVINGKISRVNRVTLLKSNRTFIV